MTDPTTPAALRELAAEYDTHASDNDGSRLQGSVIAAHECRVIRDALRYRADALDAEGHQVTDTNATLTRPDRPHKYASGRSERAMLKYHEVLLENYAEELAAYADALEAENAALRALLAHLTRGKENVK